MSNNFFFRYLEIKKSGEFAGLFCFIISAFAELNRRHQLLEKRSIGIKNSVPLKDFCMHQHYCLKDLNVIKYVSLISA